MKRHSLIIAGVTLLTICARASTPFDGLSGDRLLNAVREAATPRQLCSGFSGVNGLWQAFRSTDNVDATHIRDRFSDTDFKIPSTQGVCPEGMDCCEVIPSVYWAVSGDGAKTMIYDLVNLMPCNSDVTRNKSNYPPGTVTYAYYSNSCWAAGEGLIDGEAVNYYQPPRGYEGDFARVAFYMISTYPATRWDISSNNFIATTEMPCFQPWSLRQLLAWHESDPVDAVETARDRSIQEIQGNYNPFVRYPSLVDHLFGDSTGDSFDDDDTTGDETPDTPDDPQVNNDPLRGVYRLSDGAINLRSPYIPADASWKINGVTITQPSVAVSDLGTGIHRLEFISSTLSGKLLIEIVP